MFALVNDRTGQILALANLWETTREWMFTCSGCHIRWID